MRKETPDAGLTVRQPVGGLLNRHKLQLQAYKVMNECATVTRHFYLDPVPGESDADRRRARGWTGRIMQAPRVGLFIHKLGRLCAATFFLYLFARGAGAGSWSGHPAREARPDRERERERARSVLLNLRGRCSGCNLNGGLRPTTRPRTRTGSAQANATGNKLPEMLSKNYQTASAASARARLPLRLRPRPAPATPGSVTAGEGNK